jgi:hypothetical protein
MTWLGAILLGLGVLAMAVPILLLVVRLGRNYAMARDPRRSRQRRLDPHKNPS